MVVILEKLLNEMACLEGVRALACDCVLAVAGL